MIAADFSRSEGAVAVEPKPLRALSLLLAAIHPAVGWQGHSTPLVGPGVRCAPAGRAHWLGPDSCDRHQLDHTATPVARRTALQVATAAILTFAALLPASAEEMQVTQMKPATVMIRAAQVTEFQENMLRSYADMSEEERKKGGLAIGRLNMAQSTDILVKNTKLRNIGCDQPADTLDEIKTIASSGSGKLTREELLAMADRYAKARNELGKAFMSLTQEEQREGKEVARQLRLADEERIAANRAER